MKKTLIALAAASSLSLGACSTTTNNDTLADAATGAAVGAVGGAAVGAVVGAAAGALIPGVSLLEGAVAGAVVGGLAGAIWADNDRDGRVDGYVQNGQYYPGAPAQTNTSGTYQQPAPARSGERG
jgi:hypothetical protein